MSHWHTVDQLAAGRRADLQREAAGDVRMRAAHLAAGGGAVGDRPGLRGGPSLIGRRVLTELRSVMTFLVAHGRRLWRGSVPRTGDPVARPTTLGPTGTSSEWMGLAIQPTAADASMAE